MDGSFLGSMPSSPYRLVVNRRYIGRAELELPDLSVALVYFTSHLADGTVTSLSLTRAGRLYASYSQEGVSYVEEAAVIALAPTPTPIPAALTRV